MLQIRAIPCLLLQDKGLVKTVQFREPVYIGDPINAVRIFNECEVDELIFLDITSAKQAGLSSMSKKYQIPLNLVSKISEECYMPLSYGGGVQSIEDIKNIFNCGVEKVVINSAAVISPELIKKASEQFGNQSIVGSIDVKLKNNNIYQTMVNSGSVFTGLDPVQHAKYLESLGVGEIFVNSIDRDGLMNGYDNRLIKMITEAVSLPVIACGGAGKLEDFSEAVHQGGASAVAAGSFFVFHGKRKAVLISYPSKFELEAALKLNLK